MSISRIFTSPGFGKFLNQKMTGDSDSESEISAETPTETQPLKPKKINLTRQIINNVINGLNSENRNKTITYIGDALLNFEINYFVLQDFILRLNDIDIYEITKYIEKNYGEEEALKFENIIKEKYDSYKMSMPKSRIEYEAEIENERLEMERLKMERLEREIEIEKERKISESETLEMERLAKQQLEREIDEEYNKYKEEKKRLGIEPRYKQTLKKYQYKIDRGKESERAHKIYLGTDKSLDKSYGPLVTNDDPDRSNLVMTKYKLLNDTDDYHVPSFFVMDDTEETKQKQISKRIREKKIFKRIGKLYKSKIEEEDKDIRKTERQKQKERLKRLNDTFEIMHKANPDKELQVAKPTSELISNVPEICCDEREIDFIIDMTNDIKKIPIYSSLHDEDIYKIILNNYYYNRGYEFGPTTNIYPKLEYKNRRLSTKLFNDILTKDAFVNGINIFSLLRRTMNGLNKLKKKGRLLGGSKHTKRRSKSKRKRRTIRRR